MKPVLLGDGDVEVEASVIAEGLDLSVLQLQLQMRAGQVTSLAERGTGEDAGRHRLTFFSDHRRFRIVVDERGAVIQRSAVRFGGAGLPPSVRKPGG